jgi:hypothetical protein
MILGSGILNLKTIEDHVLGVLVAVNRLKTEFIFINLHGIQPYLS